jgi:alkaline phosphatase
MRLRLIFTLGVSLLVAASSVTSVAVTPPVPATGIRGIVLFIGDGMGLGQVSTASELLFGGDGSLFLESAPVIGLVRTFAANNMVTDSAAAATAMATGARTDRRMLGLDPSGRRLHSIFEAAARRGLATGFVTTSGLVDATPAGYVAHASSRYDFTSILRQMLSSKVDVLIGGDFTGYPRTARDRPYRELLRHAEQLAPAGTTVVRSEAALATARTPVVALLPPRSRMPEQHGPPLEITTRRALELLATNPRGFLLIVESEVTDEMGHDNNAGGVARGVAELDAAVRLAVGMVKARGDVLILVTADHDTGGPAVTDRSFPGGSARVGWTTKGHTALWVPLFAFGPGAGRFSGVLDNTELPIRMSSLLGLGLSH